MIYLRFIQNLAFFSKSEPFSDQKKKPFLNQTDSYP